MSKAIGSQISIGLAKETVRGTPNASPDFWPQVAEVSLDEKVEFAENEQNQGTIEGNLGAAIVKQYASFQIKLNVGDKSFPLVLLAALGTLNTADNADSDPTVKDHTITVAQSAAHQALSLYIDDPVGGNDYKHGLGMLESVSLEVTPGKFVSATLTGKAKKGTAAAQTPSLTAENLFTAKHATVKFASAIAGLTGASAVSVTSLKLNIKKNLEDYDVLGSADPADFMNKLFQISGELEATWESEATYKTVMQAGTYQAMRIDLLNSDVTIGSAAKPEIKIDLSRVLLKEVTRPVKKGDIIKQTVSFDAYYSTADSKMLSIVATNVQASY